jgi:pSer/pThr/pTyr-binding forkhead associated (FHA) protein
MVLCLAGGVLAEVIDKVFSLTRDIEGNGPIPGVDWNYYILGIALGLCIGLGLGITEGLYSGSRTRFWRAACWGALGGAVSGFVGFGFGGILYGQLGGDPRMQSTTVGFLQQILARSLGWGLMGMMLGTVGGWPTLSLARLRNGAIGGLIGGLVGGFVLQSLMSTPLFVGFQLRLIGFGLTGAAIGFFVGLVGEAFKQAWVKVLVGRNEGRQYVIDSAVAVIGRDELADVPIFLDPALAPRQASIRHENGRYLLYDEAGRQDTRWQGQPLAPGHGQLLTDGDSIQLGKVSLLFCEKATASPATRRVAPPATAATPAAASNVCSFCGTPRDPATGACACSVAGSPVPSFPSAAVARPYSAPTAYAPAPPVGPADNPFAPYMEEPAAAAGGWGDPVADPYAGMGASGGAPRLVGVAGPYVGHVFPLVASVVGIGRDPAQDLALAADTTTSRRHASIYGQAGVYWIRDDGSANGTYVNGGRIAEHPLTPGDEIRIGGNTFRFEA